jgi:ABC-type nitrate/sulfonate/bicarbonate transport system ATPase subunit
VLQDATLTAAKGLLAILGTRNDSTTVLLDLIDGTTRPRSGQVRVLGGSPEAARPRVVRVSLEAPLPEAMRVDEVCVLSGELRAEPRALARDRLDILGAAGLADRMVYSLSIEERRTVSLAIALTSKADVVLVEEPLASLEPVAPRLAIDALREKAKNACVVATTASSRDAAAIADELGLLTAGTYRPLERELLHVGSGGSGSLRVVVSPSHGKVGAASLVAALSSEDAVARVETAAYSSVASVDPKAAAETIALVIFGPDLVALSRAVTRAIGATRVDVELVEPAPQPLDAIRIALADRPSARAG